MALEVRSQAFESDKFILKGDHAMMLKKRVEELLAGMKAQPNLGAGYQKQFDGLYPALAKARGVSCDQAWRNAADQCMRHRC